MMSALGCGFATLFRLSARLTHFLKIQIEPKPDDASQQDESRLLARRPGRHTSSRDSSCWDASSGLGSIWIFKKCVSRADKRNSVAKPQPRADIILYAVRKRIIS